MLILFLLIGVSIHQSINKHPLYIILACISLAFSYVSATSVNDIADAKIDAINHPKSIGRPLITGEGNKSDLIKVFSAASLLTLFFATLINWWALVIMAVSLLINILYSLPPFRLSYRTFYAPCVLGIAYVGVPLSLGIKIAGSHFNTTNLLWFLGLYIMFVGRIILKDFRDRKGDKKYGKPTFLLKYGKVKTCLVSYIGVLIGGAILVYLNRADLVLSLIIVLFLISIIQMINRLQRADIGVNEQIAIGVGAKMGNGLLITILCVLILQRSNTTLAIQSAGGVLIAGIFFINYYKFIKDPASAVIGYKG